MNPYPSGAMLHCEALAEELLTAQAEDTEKFVTALEIFTAAYDKLEFPLGCPVIGYDIKDISALLGEWHRLRDEDYRDAIDLVRGQA